MVAQGPSSTSAAITVLGTPYPYTFQLYETFKPSDTIIQNSVSQ
jgi:hypothetical protein